jgi:hypothetical protein
VVILNIYLSSGYDDVISEPIIHHDPAAIVSISLTDPLYDDGSYILEVWIIMMMGRDANDMLFDRLLIILLQLIMQMFYSCRHKDLFFGPGDVRLVVFCF